MKYQRSSCVWFQSVYDKNSVPSNSSLKVSTFLIIFVVFLYEFFFFFFFLFLFFFSDLFWSIYPLSSIFYRLFFYLQLLYACFQFSPLFSIFFHPFYLSKLFSPPPPPPLDCTTNLCTEGWVQSMRMYVVHVWRLENSGQIQIFQPIIQVFSGSKIMLNQAFSIFIFFYHSCSLTNRIFKIRFIYFKSVLLLLLFLDF